METLTRATATILGLSLLVACSSGSGNDTGAGPSSTAKTPVVIITDCGTEIDDQWAILWALRASTIDVRGIIGTHAWNLKDPGSSTSAACARQVAGVVGASTRVVAGAPTALQSEDAPADGDGVSLLTNQAMRQSPQDPLVVLAMGATTDLASALLRHPEIAARIHVVMMGFQSWPAGRDSWNILNDFVAGRAVLRSKAELTVASEEACSALHRTREQIVSMLTGRGPSAGWLLARTREHWASNPVVTQDGSTLWDAAVVAYLLGHAQVEVRSRPDLNDDLGFVFTGSKGTLEWITSVDPGALDDLVSSLGGAAPGATTDGGAISYVRSYTFNEPAPTGTCAGAWSPVSTAYLPRCRATTRSCLTACGADELCQAACYDADTTPPLTTASGPFGCDSCVFLQQMACADQNGCHEALARFRCCYEANCGAGASDYCAQLRCGDYAWAVGACEQALTPECLSFDQKLTAACFP